MSEGAPDFDVGDLVVCIREGTRLYRGPGKPPNYIKGRVYQISWMKYEANDPPFDDNWYVKTTEFPTYKARHTRFRRLDPLPPEFFAGRVEERV